MTRTKSFCPRGPMDQSGPWKWPECALQFMESAVLRNELRALGAEHRETSALQGPQWKMLCFFVNYLLITLPTGSQRTHQVESSSITHGVLQIQDSSSSLSFLFSPWSYFQTQKCLEEAQDGFETQGMLSSTASVTLLFLNPSRNGSF